MIARKRAVVLVLFTVLLCGTAQQSPGYAAYERANSLFVAKKLPEALAATEEALRLDPNLIPALTLKAKLALAAYRLDVARQSLEKALALAPGQRTPNFYMGSRRISETTCRRRCRASEEPGN
jgi:tetratricopeptide (TPR) repeat protein